MNILNEDDYEEMAASFQCAQIQILDNALKENGITLKQRQKILETFTFNFGSFLDNKSFESEGEQIFPILGFSNYHAEDEDLEDIFLNNGMFSFHEYAHGNLSWYYEENADKENPVEIKNRQ